MIKTFPELYGVSSKGVVKYWKIRVEKKGSEAVIVTEHGQLGGKIQVSPETIREGKNIGRANETTPYDQAVLEAESKWKKQHDKNYTEKCPELVEGTTEPVSIDGMGKITLKLLPMLAQKYKERKKYIVWPAFVQPKLNGVRCLVERKGNKIHFWSRKAKLYKNFNLYMEQEFLSLLKDGDILDGEMYNHGDLTFQELISAIKDEKNPDIETLKKYVKFWCYDRPDSDKGFKDRFVEWKHNTKTLKGFEYIRFVTTQKVTHDAAVKLAHGQYMEEGFEGTIVRSGGDEAYRFQYRDNQLQKYKDFVDDEFKIVGAEQGSGKDEGKAIFKCVTTEGNEFSVRCKGADAVRREQWVNRKQYMGKMLTVRYQTLSDDGIPIFPVGIIVRDYE